MNDVPMIVRPSPNQLRAWAADPANAQCWGLDLIADEIERLRLSLSEETTGRTTDLARWEQERDSLEATIAEQRRSLADETTDAARFRWLLRNGLEVVRDMPESWTCWVGMPSVIPMRSKATDVRALLDLMMQSFPETPK